MHLLKSIPGMWATAVIGVMILASPSLAQRPVFFGLSAREAPGLGGMQIVGIVADSPAERSRLLRPLDVVRRINGQPVRTHMDMENVIAGITPGTQVRMDLVDQFNRPFFIFITPQASGTVAYAPAAGGERQPDPGPTPSEPGRPEQPEQPGRP